MLSPVLIASTDDIHRMLLMTVEGPLVDPAHAAALRTVLPAVPPGFSMVVDLSGVGWFSEASLAMLRDIAREAAAAGVVVVIVCSDTMRRAELVMADLDTLVPVVEAIEQALPITRLAA